MPADSKLVRDEILKIQQSIDLEGLLKLCWNYGIPVVYFNGFPLAPEVHKFNGMVAFFEGRPVIVISLNHCSPTKLLLILAHALAHIIKGHVNNYVIVDEEIKPASVDFEEIEAYECTFEILLCKPGIREHIHDDADAPKKINYYALQYLDLDKLDEDSQDYLKLALME